MAIATGTYGIGYKANGVAYTAGDSVTIDGSPVTLNGGYLTVGAFFADIAATLTGDLTGYMGYSANDGTTKTFTEAGFTFPNINIAGFRCRVMGGLGSISALDQVVLDSNGTSNGLNLVGLTTFGLRLENFEVKNTPSQNTIIGANNANPLFKEVYAHGGYSGIVNTRSTHRFVDCIFSGGYAIGHLSGNASYCENCLLIGTTSYVLQGNRPLGHFKNCTFDGVNYVDNAIGTNTYENCILLAGTHCFNTSIISTASIAQAYLPWSNNIFYSTANPTEVFAGQDLATYLTPRFWLTIQNQYNEIADPLFVGTGNLLNQYSLQSGSPAKASNKTLIAQALYPSQKRFRVTSGIWQDDVTVTYVAALDVRNGTDRGDGVLGTAYIPSPNDTETGVNVDNTVGNFGAPLIAQVALGVGFGSNDTEFVGTLVTGSIPPTLPVIIIADNEDATGATVTVAGSDAGTTNTFYYMLVGGSAFASGGSVSNDGVINSAITMQGKYWGYLESADTSGNQTLTTPVLFWVTDIAGESVRIARRERIRDNTSNAALRVAKRAGIKLIYITETGTETKVWGFVVDSNMSKSLRGGTTDERTIIFEIPRQANFPPTSFEVGDKIKHTGNNETYGIDSVNYSNEDLTQSASFKFECSRFDYGWEQN